MSNSFYSTLPKNYFQNLYGRTSTALLNGSNVCVSALNGCGGKTFFNFFYDRIKDDELFDTLLYCDCEVETGALTDFVKSQVKGRTLVIVRNFEKIKDKRGTLTYLHNLRHPRPSHLVYLFLTNHTALTTPDLYFTDSSPFFSVLFTLTPFEFEQAKELLALTSNYFGWEIKSSSYETIYSLAGGIPRLLKHICKEMAEENLAIAKADLAAFLRNPSILFELQYLNHLLITLPITSLQRLQLVDSDKIIRSLLLRRYFKTFQSEIVTTSFPNLSQSEGTILSFFWENAGHLVTLDQIADLLKMGDNDYSLWALYKTISRLNKKIKPKLEIQNLKGRGYILERLPFHFGSN